MTESEATTRANVALRLVIKSAMFTDMKSAALLQEAIDALIDEKIADALAVMSDRIEAATGVRP